MAENSEFVLELLQEFGMISEEQIDVAWEKVSTSDGSMDVIDALTDMGVVSEDELMAMLAQQYGMETLDLTGYQIDAEVVEAVPADIVTQFFIVPVMKDKSGLVTIAMVNPSDMETLDSLRYALGCDVDAVISPREQIQKLIDQHYGDLADNVDSFLDGFDSDLEAQLIASSDDDDESQADDAPIIKLVTLIIVEAFKSKVSDIHMEPLEKRYRVRYRLDGVLREVEAPPKYLQGNITSRLKIMAKLDIAEKRIPQDGRISLKIQGKEIDLRVSTIPTTHGESIVMRILDKSSITIEIPQLGFYQDDQVIIDRVLGLPDGIFLVTGPTGSGKTTSLYAFLNSINTPSRKIITAEDPIEYQLAGINQVQIQTKIGMTFVAALRAMLRQAPNIIMVGEIRDLETANIAINAALTGHLVFSTLHTNDAPSAVTRLIDMGVQPFLVASSVKTIMAQRLVRRICSSCAEPYTPEPAEMKSLEVDDEFVANSTLKKGVGCSECGNTGYKGRMGVYELFEISEDIQHLIFAKVPASKIKTAAREGGMRTLRDDALRKAASGVTTLEEVIRLTMSDEE